MVGPKNSVIGVEVEAAVERFLRQIPQRLQVPKTGLCLFNSVFVEIDDSTGMSTDIARIDREFS
jgi:calcineurin-like phosphoesterase